MITLVLNFFSNNLIEFMVFLVSSALAIRWISYKHSKRDEVYFSHFTRELNSTIDEDKAKGVDANEYDDYLNDILGRVNLKLPERNLRSDLKKRNNKNEASKQGRSLRDFVGSKHGLIASIQNESSVFNSRVAPDFVQLTDRVMNDDENWSKIFGIIPIDGVTRILDVLPTMFIVLGVFGTFIGISQALPEIAKIDFANLETSGQTLSNFVISVTFAMNTSIVGIFFSITLTLLNTLFPIEGTRERTFEKVENSIQVLWYHMQTDNVKRTNERVLPEILSTLEEILSYLSVGSDKHKKAG